MQFNRTDYLKSTAEYKTTWRRLDDSLRKTCEDYPDHSEKSSIAAKLWIIGRTFATGIERKVASRGGQGSSLTTVMEHMFLHHAEIDALFSELRHIVEPLDPFRCEQIVSIHGRFVKLLRPITRRNQSARSFASKYMHFHNSAVPIYDSVAAAAIPKMVRWTNALKTFQMPKDADDEYGWYVMRILRLYTDIVNAALPITARELDYYLLSLESIQTSQKLVAPPA